MKTIILAATLLLASCGGARDDNKRETDSGAFDELADTVDRAEAVEQQIMEQKDRMDRALDDAEKPPE